MKQITIPQSILIAGALVAFAVWFNPTISSTTAKSIPQTIKGVASNEHILGNPKSPYLLIEYSDTECPFCKKFHIELQKVVEQSNGKIAWVYRHFPLTSLHSRASKEAEATECANDQGKFWHYLDELFVRTPSNNKLDPAELPVIAQNIGLDTQKFTKCLSGGKYTKLIAQAIVEAKNSQITSTPYSFLYNTKTRELIPIKGAKSAESILQMIK